jgi:hypothetical protein
MSTDWEDWARDEYEMDMANRAIEEFQTEQLQSYYREHLDVAERPIGKLDEARSLLDCNHDAGLVFAMTSIEVGLKSILVRPIITGLVHNESLSEFITDLFVKSAKPDGVLEVVNRILKEYASIDLKTVSVSGHKKSYWEEFLQAQKSRNAILHKAEVSTKAEAEKIIELAAHLWNDLFPAILKSIGLHTHNNRTICEHDLSYCESVESLKRRGLWTSPY